MRLLMTWISRSSVVACAAVLSVTAPAAAQPFNVDIGDPGSPAGVPTSAYRAAAAQPGTWNAVPAGSVGFPLVDLAGGTTLVTLTNVGGGADFAFNNAGTTGDDQALMDDLQDVGGVGGTTMWTFNGLANGAYDVYTYAWAPDDPTFVAEVIVAGSPDPPQLVGGVWPGGHVLGVTYAVHQVTVGAGTIIVTVNTNSGFGSVNGIQLVTATCDWDLDNDGNVGVGDLLILLANWSNPYDVADLLRMLATWGPC